MNNIFESKFICKNRRIAFTYTENNEKILIRDVNFNNAFDGDTVAVEIIDNEKLVGKVIKIIKRQETPYFGNVIISKRNKYIIRINRSDLIVTCPKNKIKINQGDILSFRIDYTTLQKDDIKVNIISNFGNINNSNNILNSLLYASNISTGFSPEIKKETVSIKRPNIENDLNYRVDLRHQNTITIDDISAKDLDDAIYLEKNDNYYTLFVSIADVSYFVKEYSNLDLEAAKRGNSIYLAENVIPMLPKKLSNNLCSLNPNEDKLTFTVKLKYDLNGKLIESDFFKSIINSHHRLNYDEVNKMYKNNDKSFSMLWDMLELSKLLRKNKNKKGMINFNIPEIKLILNEDGNIKEISKRTSGLSQELIEDFMVAANEAVAEYLHWQNSPAIYRVHESPETDTLRSLNKKLNILGYNISNIMDIHPGKISKIIDKSSNDVNSYLIHKTILQSMKRAKYMNENKGHFGLALDNYLHFTSPIRRYSDLIVHRILDFSLNNKKISTKFIDKKMEEYKMIAEHISKTERTAERLEKDSIKLKILDYMKNNINSVFEARISGIISGKVFLQLENLVETVFYDSDTNKYIIENYQLHDKYGKIYNIGDKVKIKILKLDYEKIEIISEVI
ncbi:VacB/RNase II family 3'-5' exoribonuclease [Streptobacillus felis]|uniref:Ribonuclease R n=1 Tax=Streptobacillus felis TaxID=1384509 RepID=A0A7Z0T9W1_9FUSO|nr:VacB/RNase II family 3'-5' exoribonuclease [Streptobacillus felis]NYV27337.1 VacB/RNase II family 3'-5' exoribonuclease [Streptobacillus felis]